jgi:hypothetical protein
LRVIKEDEEEIKTLQRTQTMLKAERLLLKYGTRILIERRR